MIITDLLTESRVRAQVEGRSRKYALEVLSDLLGSALPDLAQHTIFRSLMNRERLGSTALEKGVALPHGRLPGLDRTVAAFVQLSTPVDFDAQDGVDVDLMMGLLVPERCGEEHLEVLAELARMFSDERYCTALRDARDAHRLYELLTGDGHPAVATA